MDAVVLIGEVFESKIDLKGLGDLPTGVKGGDDIAGGAVNGDSLGVAGGEHGKVVLLGGGLEAAGDPIVGAR